MSANTSDSNFSTAQEHGQWLFSAYERMNLFLERKREGKKEIKETKNTQESLTSRIYGLPWKFAWVNTLEALHAHRAVLNRRRTGETSSSPEQGASPDCQQPDQGEPCHKAWKRLNCAATKWEAESVCQSKALLTAVDVLLFTVPAWTKWVSANFHT